jgi:hypothetical protein
VIETLQVARYYEVNPQDVDEWTNIDFLDRQEYMYIQIEIDRRAKALTDG